MTASHLDAAHICSSLPLSTVTSSHTTASHMHVYYSLIRVPQSLALLTYIHLTSSCAALLLSINCYHTTASCHNADLPTIHTFATACGTATLTLANITSSCHTATLDIPPLISTSSTVTISQLPVLLLNPVILLQKSVTPHRFLYYYRHSHLYRPHHGRIPLWQPYMRIPHALNVSQFSCCLPHFQQRA